MTRIRAIILGLLVASCNPPPTTEQRIIAEIRDMEAQIEAGERRRFMQHVAEDFRGQGGGMNRDQLRAYIVLQFNRYQDLDARIFPVTVTEISALEATADFRALLTGGAGWLPEDGQLFQINTHWRLEGGDWMLAAASWKPIAIGEAL